MLTLYSCVLCTAVECRMLTNSATQVETAPVYTHTHTRTQTHIRTHTHTYVHTHTHTHTHKKNFQPGNIPPVRVVWWINTHWSSTNVLVFLAHRERQKDVHRPSHMESDRETQTIHYLLWWSISLESLCYCLTSCEQWEEFTTSHAKLTKKCDKSHANCTKTDLILVYVRLWQTATHNSMCRSQQAVCATLQV